MTTEGAKPCLFFGAERSLPECLPSPPIEPVRYAVIGLELLQDLIDRCIGKETQGNSVHLVKSIPCCFGGLTPTLLHTPKNWGSQEKNQKDDELSFAVRTLKIDAV